MHDRDNGFVDLLYDIVQEHVELLSKDRPGPEVFVEQPHEFHIAHHTRLLGLIQSRRPYAAQTIEGHIAQHQLAIDEHKFLGLPRLHPE